MSDDEKEKSTNRKGLFKIIFKLVMNLFSLAGWLIILVFLAAVLWNHYGPEKVMPNKKRQDIAIKSVDKITEQIRTQRGETRRVILLHFANDSTGFVTDTLRDKLNSSGILTLDDMTLLEKFRKKMGIREEGYSSKLTALNAVKGRDAEGVLWGTIEKYESFEGGVILKGSWQIVDIKTGDIICEGTLDEDTSKKAPAKVAEVVEDVSETMAPVAEATQEVPWYIRFLIFVLAVLLLPIMTISFLRTMVAKHSNGLNASILTLYTLIGAILAFFMVGASFDSGWSVVMFIAASVIAFIYNYFIMCFALKLES